MTTPDTIAIDRYYTTLDYFAARYDLLARQRGLRATTPDEFAAWKAQLRAELAECIGLTTMTPADLCPRVVESVAVDGYVREKVILQTEPGVFMPLYVLLPGDLAPGERRPALIAPHGHASAGKLAVVGYADTPSMAQTVAQYNYAYGVAMVQAGFVVFCPDARGFGERRESCMQGETAERHYLHGSCTLLNHMAIPLGQTVTGMWTWDLMRLLDYLQQRPECDASRIGCAGLSGGGLQTLWLAALDDRVKCAVVSGYFYGYKESLLIEHANCSCNYVPHLWEKVDMGDIAALIAPRLLFIETGDQDPLNGNSGLANVLSQLEITAGAYRLFDAEANLRHHIFAGPHRWDGSDSLPWLQRQFQRHQGEKP